MQRQFHLQSSRYLVFVLIAIHSVAMMSMLLLPLPGWAKIVLVILLSASLLHYLRQNAWLSARSSQVALSLRQQEVMLTSRESSEVAAKVMAESFVMPLLTIVTVLPHGARRKISTVIFPDSLDAESFRKLRVLLKWES